MSSGERKRRSPNPSPFCRAVVKAAHKKVRGVVGLPKALLKDSGTALERQTEEGESPVCEILK